MEFKEIWLNLDEFAFITFNENDIYIITNCNDIENEILQKHIDDYISRNQTQYKCFNIIFSNNFNVINIILNPSDFPELEEIL